MPISRTPSSSPTQVARRGRSHRRKLQPGDIVYIDRRASCQFAAEPFAFRVIGIQPGVTVWGWIWVDGYQLGPNGEAVDRRSIYVWAAGLDPTVRIPAQRAKSEHLTPSSTPGS